MNTGLMRRDVTAQIYAEQVAHLYGHGALAYTFSLINGAILTGVEWFFRRPSWLWVAWFGGLILVTSARALLAWRYHRLAPQIREARHWYRAYWVGAALAGLTWGAASVFLFPSGDIEHQVFLIMIVAGMIAGAVSVLSARLEAFLAFALPTLLPLSAQLWAEGSPIMMTMSAVTLIYLLGMTLAARGLNRTMLSSLALRFDNRELVAQMRKRERAEEALYQEKERLQIVLQALAEGVVILEADGTIRYLNPAAEQLCRRRLADVRGKPMRKVFLRGQEGSHPVLETVEDACLRTGSRMEGMTALIISGGGERFIEEIATPLRDGRQELIGAVAVLRDVTQAQEHSRQLAFQANHDALTRLPNRTLLLDRLRHAIDKAARSRLAVALLFMDLDRFKTVNDGLGHAVGDALLRAVAARLTECLREEDTVARLGGDEFVVVLESIKHENQATAASRKIMDAFDRPFLITGYELFVTASVGIALFPRDGTTADVLLKNADVAMYRSKAHGRNTVEFYESAMNARAMERHTLEQQLRYAVARNELELYYQPRIDLRSGGLTGVEALLRWHHPRNGLVLPSEFVTVAEESGAIAAIGEWVLKSACKQLREWLSNGMADLRISVNLSVWQLRNEGFSDLVTTALREADLEARHLELEMTESVFLSDVTHAMQTLETLRERGIRLAIDDFGTGYSSFSYLKRCAVDVLKIDRSFITDLASAPGDEAIVSAMIDMGRGLKLRVVAEGVENRVQADFLKAKGCHECQGYYYSPPRPAGEIAEMLAAGRVDPP